MNLLSLGLITSLSRMAASTSIQVSLNASGAVTMKGIWISAWISLVFSSQLCAASNCPSLLSIYEMQGQKDLRKALAAGKLRTPQAFIYSYSSPGDQDIYVDLANGLRAKLTTSQADAFSRYTGGGGTYDAINGFLSVGVGHRSEIPASVGRARVSPEIPKLARALDSIFPLAAPLPRGLILFRGVASSEEDIQIPEPGETLRLPQFLSTSLDPAPAHHFATYNDEDHRAIFIIKIGNDSIRGLPVGNTDETEILLPRSLILRVESKRIAKDRNNGAPYWIVELTALGQQFDIR